MSIQNVHKSSVGDGIQKKWRTAMRIVFLKDAWHCLKTNLLKNINFNQQDELDECLIN